MPIINKTNNTAAIYNRGREVVKVYDHGKLAWQKSIPDYLCFTALEAGQFTLTIPAAVTATYLSYVEWSKDGRTWNHTDNTSDEVIIPVSVASGEKVYWRGSGKRMSYSGNSGYTSGFSSTGAFSISGHLVSILKGSDFEDIDFLGATFARLFQDCSNLISAGELILPSFTTASVFSSLFLRCTALVSAPELPPVTNLTTGCYYQMFFGCSSLAYVKCLATNISATNCLQNWLYGVSSTGTFIQAEGVTWPRGASGIPTGWLAYDEGEDIPNDYEKLDYAGNDSGRAWVNVGAVTHILEAYQITFRTPVIGTQVICGYFGLDTEADPVQASQNYLYARASPDSFQHQHYRINGDSYSSQNGLLQNIRDTEWHTFKTWDDNGCRRLEFDGVDKGTSTREYATKKENLDMYLFHYQGTNGYANVHISEFIRYEEDAETETMHLLPCKRKSDDVVGFWDTIGLQFLTSGNAHALIGGYLTNNENNE